MFHDNETFEFLSGAGILAWPGARLHEKQQLRALREC